MIVEIIYDKNIMSKSKWKRRKYERVTKEFNHDIEGLEDAINYCFGIDSNTPYFNIVYDPGNANEERNFAQLVMDLKHFCLRKGYRDAEDKLEIRKQDSEIYNCASKMAELKFKNMFDDVKKKIINMVQEEFIET